FMVLCGILALDTVAFGSDEVITPNDALVVDGLPAIPKSLAERSAAYAESRAATFQDWHPTKREILILTRFADVQQVHRVAFPGGDRRQVTFYNERVVGARYRPESEDIVFHKDIGGGEWFQLYLRDGKTGKVTMFTDGKSRNTGG